MFHKYIKIHLLVSLLIYYIFLMSADISITPIEIYEMLKQEWIMDIVSVFLWKKVDNLSINHFILMDDDVFVQLRYNTVPILSAKSDNFLSKLVPIFKYIKQLKTGKIDLLSEDFTERDVEYLQTRAISIGGINERYLMHKVDVLEKLVVEMKEILMIFASKINLDDSIKEIIEEPNMQIIIPKKEFVPICENISKKYPSYLVYLIFADDNYFCSFNKNMFNHKKYSNQIEISDIITSSFLLYQLDNILVYVKPINNQNSTVINIYDDLEKMKMDIKN